MAAKSCAVAERCTATLGLMDFSQEDKKIVELLMPFAGLEPNDRLPGYVGLRAYIKSLVSSKGWGRREIYALMQLVAKKYRTELPPESFDALDDYITSLTGDVAPECFERFPGEPENLDEFVAYVRSRRWMPDDV